MSVAFPTKIQPTECIGNSLYTINTNFDLLKTGNNDNYTLITQLQNLINTFVGSVAYFASVTPPTNWLELSGGVISRANYASLWTFAKNSGNIVTESLWYSTSALGGFSYGDGDANSGTTFRIPNLRGSFVRGYGTQSLQLSSGLFARWQSDLVGQHTHTIQAGLTPDSTGTQRIVLSAYGNSQTNSNSINSLTTGETRPRNIPLLPCIYFGTTF
jgi:microcystin-dependent protein